MASRQARLNDGLLILRTSAVSRLGDDPIRLVPEATVAVELPEAL